MAGIYIHIPYCKKACHYCNFHFSANVRNTNDMVYAIGMEARLRRHYITEKINTVYFGGGTPSLIPITSLRTLMQKMRENFIIAPDAEITLEANPDDINIDSLLSWKSIGINRLSIGIQSFRGEDLVWMNRAHNAQQAIRCIQLAKRNGFSNLSIDLIYGTPTLSDEQWKQNIAQAVSLGIPHLSCYALTVEPKTALHSMIEKGKMPNVSEDKQSIHFDILTKDLREAGYDHYEISNFAKPGWQSKHNSSYWQGKPYIGLGPSAHSFNGTSRQWNVANNALYITALQKGEVPFEVEQLTPKQQLNEYIMTSLRTMQGTSLKYIARLWSDADACSIIKDARKHIVSGYMNYVNQHLVLTRKGKLLADGIAAELFR